MSDDMTVAVMQCPAEIDGAQARMAWLSDMLAGNLAEKPDLVVLPELFQCGYHIGGLVRERAEEAGGPFAAAIAQLACQHETAILYGYAESHGDAFYNSAICIDDRGRTIGHHRKLLLPPGFEGDQFTPGSGCELFKIGDFTLAILICYDVEFPETVRHVALAGADLVVVPTALGVNWGVVSQRVVPARAFENGVFLVYANYCGTEHDLQYLGGSCVVAPDGRDLARAGASSQVLTAQLSRAAVVDARERLPYLEDRKTLPL